MQGRPRVRLVIGCLAAAAAGTGLTVGLAAGQATTSTAETQAIVGRQLAALRLQCMQSARDAALVDVRAQDEQRQREWCSATRDARRGELAAAFVESVRRAKDGGNGAAKAVDQFLKKTPAAIKPLAPNTATCADEKLRIDETLVEPVIDEPSLVGSLFGVRLNGKRVSRLNPVPRWDRLQREGLVTRSSQIVYSSPFPVATGEERNLAVARVEAAACPAQTQIDQAFAVYAARAAAGAAVEPGRLEKDASELVMGVLADSYQRRRLGPLVQLAQSSARLPGLSPACERDLRVLLSDEELARRISSELVRLVNPRALQRVVDVRRALTAAPFFTNDGQLRLVHPGDDAEQVRVAEVYGADGASAFMVDAADVTVATTQAVALGLYNWSSARSDLIARGCLPGN